MMTLKEFGTSDKKLCIFLTRKEANKINKLVFNDSKCYLVERRSCFSTKPYLLLNKKAYFCNLEKNIMNANDLFIVSELIDTLIFITEIKEFVELLENKAKDNHEKDVFDYMNKSLEKCLLNTKLLATAVIKIDKQPRGMLIINKDKKYVIYKVNNKEYRVDCHNDDKFDWQIGFGLALSKCFGKSHKWQRARENFRHNIINEEDGKVKRVLDYESYSKWCIYEYYHNDTDEIKNLKNKVKEINELGKVDL